MSLLTSILHLGQGVAIHHDNRCLHCNVEENAAPPVFIRGTGASLSYQVIASQHTRPLQGLDIHFYPIVEIWIPTLWTFLCRLPWC